MPSLPDNFAKLRESVAIHSALDQNARIRTRSHLKVFCKVVGVPEGLLACDVDLVRTLMNQATPAAYGIFQGYWRTICSGVWRGFELAGFKVLRGTGLALTSQLADLLRDVPRHPEQTELTPILKYLLDQKLSAWELTQEHVPQMREWLRQFYVRCNWSRTMKKSLARWKQCQQTYGDRWPQAPLEPEYENKDRALPWAKMPDLEVDLDAHIDELRQTKGRRHGGNRRILKLSTLKARKGHMRRLASAIALATGTVPKCLEDLTSPESVERGVDYIMDTREAEVSGDVYQMLRHVNAIARHHVRRPKEQLEELTLIRRSVAPPSGAAEKNRVLIQKFRNPDLRQLFINSPTKVLRQLKRKKALTRRDLIEGMLAFLAALLTKLPMRISEAMALKFGETLHDNGSGRHRQVIVDIPGDMVKNEMPRHAKLGPRLVALFDIYLELVRKPLAEPGNPHLFPSTGIAARSPDHMSRQLAAWTTRHVIRMTAHQWRHVVGYIYLIEHPGCYETVKRFLGHRSITTTMRYYAFALEDDANESLDETIDRISDRSVPPRRRGKRRC